MNGVPALSHRPFVPDSASLAEFTPRAVVMGALLGGLLGILMMIPLRRTLIVARHGELKYPEGTACAEVLKAAESSKSARAGGSGAADSSRAGVIFLGFGIGLLYKTVNIALKGWKDVPE